MLALADLAGLPLQGVDLALAAQRAEHVATGVPCGIQDQMASVCGRAGHAVFLDCRTLEIELLPMPPELGVLVVHCGVPRTLAGTPYAQRRAESEAVAARLGVRVLRDATIDQVRDIPRGRHAVTEMDTRPCVRAGVARAATSTRSARSCSRATRRRATTWRCRSRSSTCSSSVSSTRARSVPASRAPASAVASSRSARPRRSARSREQATAALPRTGRPRTDGLDRAGSGRRGPRPVGPRTTGRPRAVDPAVDCRRARRPRAGARQPDR